MKLYRNHYSVEGGSSGGFSWHTTIRDAKASAVTVEKANKEKPHTVAELIELKPGKEAMVRFLNNYAGHPDNG